MKLSSRNQVEQILVEAGITNLGTSVRKIELHEGGAWLTYDDHDVALKAGQTIEIESTTSPVLIEPLAGCERIVFNYEVTGSALGRQQIGASPFRLRTIATVMSNAFRG